MASLLTSMLRRVGSAETSKKGGPISTLKFISDLGKCMTRKTYHEYVEALTTKIITIIGQHMYVSINLYKLVNPFYWKSFIASC